MMVRSPALTFFVLKNMKYRKNRKEKFVFYDPRGRRWSRIKTVFVFFSTVVILSVFVGLAGLFGQKQNQLVKVGQDTNFDVIDQISSKEKDVIRVGGQGTFVGIKTNASDKEPHYDIDRFWVNQGKKIALTFDDGPDPNYSLRIAEILKREGVPATFFLVGQQVEHYPKIAKQIVAGCFEVGNHTFSHTDFEEKDYQNKTKIDFEINFNQNLIQSTTGVKTKLFRDPYWGSDQNISMYSLILTTFALDKGYKVSSPTLDSNDWQERDPAKIFFYSTTNEDTVVLLLHDGGGDREATVRALPSIINYYRSHGYTFANLSSLYGEKLNLAPSNLEDISSNLVVNWYNLVKNFARYISPLFVAGLFFTIFYAGFVTCLSIFETVRLAFLKRKLRQSNFAPAVSVVIPAYNEEKTIAKTIRSVLASNYKRIKLLIVDDGSTDQTYNVAKRFEKDKRVKVFHKSNGGKFSALNFGLEKVKTEIFVAVDADTQIEPSAIENLVKPFLDPTFAAVAGNVKVGNRNSLLGIFQSIEYTMNLNLERNGYSLLNSILVVPGALGAWRSTAVRKVGGYSSLTLTEDAELTLRLLRDGWRILYEKEAIAFTETPQTIRGLVDQRFRWTFGIIQTLFTHRDLLFKKGSSFLGIFVLPFAGLVQVPLMFLTPLMDLLAVYYLFFVSWSLVIFYFLIYLGVRVLLGLVAFGLGKEEPWVLIFMPLQRLVYQPILYLSSYLVLTSLLKGNLVAWRKTEHRGDVVLDELSPLVLRT